MNLADWTVSASLGGTGTHQQGSELSPKKIRKPYTITKSRESWNDQEHEKFLEALQLFDRDWKKIESFVGTKSVIQIRSHAQKYFLKVEKNGTGEHFPPPRPKRKSAQLYPQKSPKTGPVQQQIPHNAGSSTSSSEARIDVDIPGFNVYEPFETSTTISAWGHPESFTWSGFNISKPGSIDILNGRNLGINSCSSAISSDKWSQDMLLLGPQSHQSLSLRATPNFAEVYKFIGRVFDPGVDCHLKALLEMAPIDCQTVLLLMKNLVANLSSPNFQDYLDAIGLTSFSGEEAWKQLESNVDDNLWQFGIGDIGVFHPHSGEAQLASPTYQQLSDGGSFAEIMSLPPLVENSP